MIIHEPQIERVGERVRLSSRISDSNGPSSLWFEYHPRHEPYVDSRFGDAMLMALFMSAMESGDRIVVRAPVSRTLLSNLRYHVGPIVSLQRPELELPAVTVEEVVDRTADPSAGGVALGMSCGVDSLYSLSQRFLEADEATLRVDHLCFFDVGSHGRRSERQERLKRERLDRVSRLARDYDLELINVDSNLDAFYTSPFQATNTFRSAAAATTLSCGIRRYLISSARGYQQMLVGPAHDPAFADACLVPMLGNDAILFEVAGVATRPEKIRALADTELATRYLDVCVRNRGLPVNCGRCVKCIRTLLVLDSIGKLDRFEAVFDTSAFRKNRHAYFAANRHKVRRQRRRSPQLQDLDEDFMVFRTSIGHRAGLREWWHFANQAATIALARLSWGSVRERASKRLRRVGLSSVG